MKVQPYLFFNGRCEEALEFYRRALGAEVPMLMRFRDNPDAGKADSASDGSGAGGGCGMPPGSEDKVMHAEIRVGGAVFMASDGMASDGRPSFAGVSLALSVPDAATVDRFFNALADGGQVQMPLAKTFWAERFGVVADRFGVSWMVGTEG